jgi:hypothetical protein
MNIFILDANIDQCVQAYCDKHVVKMPLETAQILCTVHHCKTPFKDIPYKPYNPKHPCIQWACKSLQNYQYLTRLGLKICSEYSFRFEKQHKSENVIKWCCLNNWRLVNMNDDGLTPFFQAMPIQYHDKNAVNAYRKYYNNEKRHIAQWRKRKMPQWFDMIK